MSSIFHIKIWLLFFLLICIAGMIGIGAEGSSDKEKYLKLGEDLAHTCHESYIRTGKISNCVVTLLYLLPRENFYPDHYTIPCAQDSFKFYQCCGCIKLTFLQNWNFKKYRHLRQMVLYWFDSSKSYVPQTCCILPASFSFLSFKNLLFQWTNSKSWHRFFELFAIVL